jgi:hypothetical protein
MASKPKPFTLPASEPEIINAATGGLPSKKLRISLQSGSMGVMLAADLLGAKDADNEGWDDYFAMKLRDIALDMQHVALTGKLPTDAE